MSEIFATRNFPDFRDFAKIREIKWSRKKSILLIREIKFPRKKSKVLQILEIFLFFQGNLSKCSNTLDTWFKYFWRIKKNEQKQILSLSTLRKTRKIFTLSSWFAKLNSREIRKISRMAWLAKFSGRENFWH